jgi:pimeloyl-ACP methyl ester carboxylesterase
LWPDSEAPTAGPAGPLTEVDLPSRRSERHGSFWPLSDIVEGTRQTAFQYAGTFRLLGPNIGNGPWPKGKALTLTNWTIAAITVVAFIAAGTLILFLSNRSDTLRGIKLAMLLAPHREALARQCPVAATPAAAMTGKPAINVVRWGDSISRMLIIHGGVQGNVGGGPLTFREQRPLANAGWQLILPERPGFGQSPSRGPDDMEGDAVWISEMLDDVVLIGHSFGGAEALLAAARRPGGVRALVLIEPALHALFPRSKVFAENEEARKDFLNFGEASLEAASPAEFGRLFVRSLLGPDNRGAARPDCDAATATLVGCALLQAKISSSNSLRKAAEIVAAAKIPVLVISGGWSPTLDAISELAAQLTNGKHIIVPSPNHFPQQINPEAFNSVLLSFANKYALASRTEEPVPTSR